MRLPLPLGCILAAAHVPLAPHAPASRLPRSRAPVCSADAGAATVHFIAPAHVNSPFGATSPDPSPAWLTVGTHLAERLSYYDARLTGTASADVDAAAIASADLVVVLGMDDPSAARDLEAALAAARGRARGCVCVECDRAFDDLEFVGPYTPSAAGPLAAAKRAVVPWGEVARGSRIYDTASSLLRRWSSEDAFYAIFFILHAFVLPIKLVEHSVRAVPRATPRLTCHPTAACHPPPRVISGLAHVGQVLRRALVHAAAQRARVCEHGVVLRRPDQGGARASVEKSPRPPDDD